MPNEYALKNVIPDPMPINNQEEFLAWLYENFLHIQQHGLTGTTGTFTSGDGKTITVTNGIITNIE